MRARAAVALVAAACGPIAGGPPLPAPINDCPTHACSLYQPFQAGGPDALCNHGLCAVKSALDYTLVVTLPETSYYAPGETFVLPASQLFSRPATDRCQLGLCAHLPSVGIVNGQYRPLRSAQDAVGYYIGQVAALPVRVTYRPAIAPPNPMQPPATSDAAAAGIPFLSELAQVDFPIDGVQGPGGGPPPGFRAVLPPGTYERTIVPESPYDAFFPPEVVTIAVASGVQSLQAGSSVLTFPDTIPEQPPKLPTFDLTRADGAPLDGWTTYLRDQTTLRRLSTTVVVGPNDLSSTSPPTYHVALNTNHHPPSNDALKGTDLLVVPPRGADAAPTLVAPYLGGVLKVPPYPLIPPPATVRGAVTVNGASPPASAELVFRSKKIYLTTAQPSFTTNLVYEARATAAAIAGADLRYAVRLPRGEYDVIVTPSDGGAAKALLAATVAVDLDVQDGKDFALPPKRALRALARVSDGRPLAGATIVASAASTLAAAGAEPERAPRTATATTDVDGAFVLYLDEGTYDIAVRPADGSRLPWVVVPARAIQTGVGDLVLSEPIDVPAPIALGLTLADPQDNPIVRALVRAFAVPTGGTAFVEVGRALTDASGHYDSFLAGTPHP